MVHAIRIHQTGGPEVMKWDSVEVPAPGPGQVRLKQHGVDFRVAWPIPLHQQPAYSSGFDPSTTYPVAEAVASRILESAFRTEIPINIRLAEAPGLGRPIFDTESWSTGAVAYGLLGGEVLRRGRKAGLV